MTHATAQHGHARHHHLSVGGALALGILLGGGISVMVMGLTAFSLKMLS